MEQTQSDPRLVLKVTPPRVPKAAVMRQRLSSNAQPLVDRALVLVDARSGFGKTTLLAHWRREALQRGAVVAWLTADAEDQPLRFAAGLGLAMKTASGRSAFTQIDLVSARDADGALDGLTEWLSQVALMATESILVIDDVHLLPDLTRRLALAYLLHNAPANLRIILAARGTLDLPVADWVGHGQFAELGMEDLRLRLPETIALLNGRFGTRIDPDDCARLHELTEGWPLGLQLAIATIERHGDVREGITALSARSGDIRRYFVECLVARLPEHLVDFLVRIAISEDVHPELCRAITGCVESPAYLAHLADETPIFAQGINGEWLRLHPLARDFLLERFALLPAPEQKTLHLQAADWLAANGMPEAAARQCLAGEENGKAYDLIEQGLFSVLTSGQAARAMEWIEHLPAEEIMRRPRLRLTAGWLMALSERHAEALALVEPMRHDGSMADEDRCECALICSVAAYFADDLAEAARNIAPWVDARSALPALHRASICNHAAALMLYQGNTDRMRRFYKDNMPGEATGLSYIRGWAEWTIGFSYLWEGAVIQAEESLRAALQRIETATGRRSPIAVELAALLGAVLWERNQPEEAGTALANRLDVLEKRGGPESIMMGFIVAARAAAASGLERRAYDLLESLYSLGEVRSLPRLCIYSLGEQIRMHCLRGHREACATLEGRLDRVSLDAARRRWGEIEALVDIQIGIAHAYAAISRNDWPRVPELLALPGRLADERRRVRDALQIRLLRALAMRRCGDDGDSLLAESLNLADIQGLERIVVDTHPDLVDWARTIRSPGIRVEPVPIRHADLIPLTRPARDKTVAARVSPSAILTPKERDILRLMADNLTNKQIGLAMDVSYQTIKWHLKNLFVKLNADTRRHALDQARMFGLLD
jgi:LuxR family maltose regulon positive regulatory protein